MERQLVGYRLVDAKGNVVSSWGGVPGVVPDMPNKIRLPNGDDVHCPVLGTDYDGYSLVEWFMNIAPTAPSVPDSISDRQFFQQLAVIGAITKEEALAAVKTGEIPTALQAFIETLDEEEKFAASMIVSGAVTFHRNHPLTKTLAAGMKWTDEQVDDLWRAAAEL